MRQTLLIHFKFALLATFVLFTLIGLAGPNLQALFIGASALGASVLIALANLLAARAETERRALHSTL